MGAPLDFKGAERLKPEARKNIIGIESQLWCETVKGREMLEYYVLPKLMGFAESAWAPERSWESIEDAARRKQRVDEEWNIFANRLARVELPRLHYLNGGYNYRVPAPGVLVENNLMKANTELPGLKIYYTTDGTEPTTSSHLFSEPVPVNSRIQVRAFDSSGRGSRIITAGN